MLDRSVLDALNRNQLARLRLYYERRASMHGIRVNFDAIDLDLVAAGLLRPDGPVMRLTDNAVHVLAQAREANKTARQQTGHQALIAKLGEHLALQGRMVWGDIELKGTPPAPPTYTSSYPYSRFCRADVFSMVVTYNSARLCPIIHEIKASRADFLTDVQNPQKRAAYLSVADYLVYVCEKDLIKKDEIPKGCGLLYHVTKDDGGVEWVPVLRGRKHKRTLNDENLLRLMFKQHRVIARPPSLSA